MYDSKAVIQQVSSHKVDEFNALLNEPHVIIEFTERITSELGSHSQG